MPTRPSTLVIVVPGLGSSETAWQPLLFRLKAEPFLKENEAAKWLFWQHKLWFYSFVRVAPAARQLAAFINQQFEVNGPFDKVILVGHSMGGLLLREAYLVAADAYGTGKAARDNWTGHVDRFVLFACLSRGFDPTARLDLRLGVAFARALRIFPRSTAYDLIKGSAFVTNLRIAWIRYFSKLAEAKTDPTVVQLLGTIDGLVRREDCLDTEQFPKGEIIDIPFARHDDVFKIDQAPDPEARYRQIVEVFKPTYHPASADQPFVPKAKDVIFVLHGIRANNTGWVRKACEVINANYSNVEAVPPFYGYFSALHFFFPYVRRNRARFFQDKYSELAAQYASPQTRFFFMGHSNGTYLLGRALESISMMRFERAYLAGSVLPAKFPWAKYVKSGQLKELRSDGGAADWPVGWLCSALSFMGDIGTGGFSGFEETPPPSAYQEFLYFPGDHSVPVETDSNLEQAVKFVLGGAKNKPTGLLSGPSHAFGFISRAARYLGPVLLAALAVLAVFGIIWLSAVSSIWISVGVVVAVFLALVIILSF